MAGRACIYVMSINSCNKNDKKNVGTHRSWNFISMAPRYVTACPGPGGNDLLSDNALGILILISHVLIQFMLC